jgi:hypothetical protein
MSGTLMAVYQRERCAVANPRVIDYYAILAVPPSVDLAGIETAYSRLSGELVTQSEHDETSRHALNLLNEAYSVLSAADARRQYDRVLFQTEFAVLDAQRAAEARRQRVARWLVMGALGAVVLVQSIVLVYIGREYVGDALSVVLGPLMPGQAG